MGEIIRLPAKVGPKLPSESLLNGEHFPLLAGMAPVLLHLLNESAALLHVSDGVEILQQGDIPQDLYFVEDGVVAVVKKTKDGIMELRHLGVGEVFGELGALRGRSRVASVYTLEHSRIIRVQADTVRQLMGIDADFRRRVNMLMDRRMIETFLTSHPVFEDLSEEALLSLALAMQLKVIPKGKRLIGSGELLHGIYLIVAGEVGVSIELPSGEEVLLEMRRDNEVLGELRDGRSGGAAYSATTSCETDVLHFDDSVMQILRSHSPDIARRLDDFIARRTQATKQRIKQHLS